MKQSAFDVTHQNLNIESKIVASLERVAQAFRVLLWEESKTFSLSPIQIQVLIFLLYHSDEKRKVSYLAHEFNLTKATISDTVKTLEQKKLIVKEFESHDSRSYKIYLTPEGTATAQKIAMFTQQIQAPIDRMEATEKENLLFSLLNIIKHLNQTGVITIQRMCFSCQHYQTDATTQSHYCHLLQSKLEPTELRVDCNEHCQAS